MSTLSEQVIAIAAQLVNMISKSDEKDRLKAALNLFSFEKTASSSPEQNLSLEKQTKEAFKFLTDRTTEESFAKSKALISKNKKMRGYIDGGFDLVHSGHFNAIR